MATDHIMTDEVKKLLISRLPFSTNAVTDFTPPTYMIKDDSGVLLIPEEFRPVFSIRAFTKLESDTLKKSFVNAKNNDENLIRSTARKATMGWRNMYDVGTGDEIPFEADELGQCTRALFDTLPLVVVSELLNYMSQVSGIIVSEVAGL